MDELTTAIPAYFQDGAKQYFLVGIAGSLGLYQNTIWSHSVNGTHSWAVGSPDKTRFFSDRPTPKKLKENNYKLPEGTPDRWTKVDIDA